MRDVAYGHFAASYDTHFVCIAGGSIVRLFVSRRSLERISWQSVQMQLLKVLAQRL